MEVALLKGKKVLVTGSTRGIGNAIAHAAARLGATVLIHGTNKERAHGIAKEVADLHNSNTYAYHANFNSSEETQAFIRIVQEDHDSLDAIVLNAGIAHSTVIDAINPDEYEKIMRVNASTPFFLATGLLPLVRASRRGSLLFIISISGIRGRNRGAVYSISKSAVVGMVRSFAKEVGAQGINTNGISPGLVETDLTSTVFTNEQKQRIVDRTPLKRLCTKDDVALLAAFLVSDNASCINGEVVTIDGGYSIN